MCDWHEHQNDKECCCTREAGSLSTFSVAKNTCSSSKKRIMTRTRTYHEIPGYGSTVCRDTLVHMFG